MLPFACWTRSGDQHDEVPDSMNAATDGPRMPGRSGNDAPATPAPTPTHSPPCALGGYLGFHRRSSATTDTTDTAHALDHVAPRHPPLALRHPAGSA